MTIYEADTSGAYMAEEATHMRASNDPLIAATGDLLTAIAHLMRTTTPDVLYDCQPIAAPALAAAQAHRRQRASTWTGQDSGPGWETR